MQSLIYQTALIVEDEMLIAMDIEDTLSDMGFREVMTLASHIEACFWLETNTPDVALIDMWLKDGQSDRLAAILTERNIPLIVHSGDRNALQGAFEAGYALSKPATPEQITQAVLDLARHAG